MKTLLTFIALSLSMFAFSSSAEAASCDVSLQNGRGRILEYFHARGYDRQDACQEAKQKCKRARRNGRYSARTLTCVVAGRGGQQRDQYVTRRCSAELIGPRGRTINYFNAQASGYRGNGVKQQACQKARRKCSRYKNQNGYRRAQCSVTRGSGRNW